MSNQDNYVFIVLNIIALYDSTEELLGHRLLVSHFDHRTPPPRIAKNVHCHIVANIGKHGCACFSYYTCLNCD